MKILQIVRNAFYSKVAIKRGVTIYKQPCISCVFACTPGEKQKMQSYSCINPYLSYLNKIKKSEYNTLIKCPSNFDECKFYKITVNKLLPDFEYIKKYINKYSESGWLNIPEKHLIIIIKKKIRLHNIEYLKSLLSFFNYLEIYREDADIDGLLFTLHKDELSEFYRFSRYKDFVSSNKNKNEDNNEKI